MSDDNIGLRQHFLNYWTTNVKDWQVWKWWWKMLMK